MTIQTFTADFRRLAELLQIFADAPINDHVLEESNLFAECLAAGWPGLGADHVEWACAAIARNAFTDGKVVDFSVLPHRVLQWMAYESTHPLAESAYDYLDALPGPVPGTQIKFGPAPTGLRIGVRA